MNNSSQCEGPKQRYKLLLDESNILQQGIGHQLPSAACQAVQDIVMHCDNIYTETPISEKVENASEIVMDTQLMKNVHESVSKLLLANSEFSDSMYSNAINALISQNESDNWEAIAKIALNVATPANTKASMLGAIDVEPKERVIKERQQRRRTISQEKRPETIKQLKRNDRGAEKVNIILKQVSDKFREYNRQPIPYYRLIIDPNNFMNTVENALQMAFLARDGNIAIESGEDGYPQVRLVPKDELVKHMDTSQAICSLNMKLCDNMIEFYNIKEPMLFVPADMDDNSSTHDNSDGDDD